MKLIKEQSNYLSGKLKLTRRVSLDHDAYIHKFPLPTPQPSVSTAAVSVLFMKLWYCEIHFGCAFNALVLRFCLCTSVLEITCIH